MIRQLTDLDDSASQRLLAIWEASVRATHDFLTEADIQALRPQVAQGLAAILQEGCLLTADDGQGQPLGFMGVAGDKIEMLFIDPASRGQGLGRQLVTWGIARLGVRQVDVNEQNPQADGFYRHLGFQLVSRSPLDDQGRPFPILHLALASDTTEK